MVPKDIEVTLVEETEVMVVWICSTRNAGNNNGNQSNGNPNWNQYRDTRKRCFICESVLPLANSCPDNPASKSKSPQQLNLQLFSEQSEMCFLEQFVSETLNCAIVDSGCTYNVCGKNWLKCYMDKFPSDVIFEE